MADVVIMPRQGQSVESCIIAKWHKKKGDPVKAGDVLFTYETDKSSFDEEAKSDGILLDVFFEEGDDVECLKNVCVIGQEGEETACYNPNLAEEKQAETAPAAESAPAEEAKPVQAEAAAPASYIEGDFVKISPRARHLADKLDLDYRFANPSGPNGRIIERDIRAINAPMYTKAAGAAKAAGIVEGTGIGGRITTADLRQAAQTEAASAGIIGEAASVAVIGGAASAPMYEDVKIPNIRKVIAKSMHSSLSEMAQLTLNSSFDATEIMALRQKLKENAEKSGLNNITLNDIVMFAVSHTLLNHKDINANFINGDTMRYFHTVNLGMAVDTPRGLMVPTIEGAEHLSLNELAAISKSMANACKEGSISPDALKNGSFTVTNLGSLGVESFTPVINPPQTAILGVDAVVKRPREVNGEIKLYPAMGLSLTFDHRAVDGAPAAKFLKELCYNLENFSVMLVK